jgi:ketosteroid isomerase-like protein
LKEEASMKSRGAAHGRGGRRVVEEFVRSINDHDVEGLFGLMHEDHVFIDAHGVEARGARLVRNAWKEYFEWFPDYKLVVERVLERGSEIAVFGLASGTYGGGESRDRFWMLPAAWRAVVEDGLVKEWQVYCDTKVVYDIMERNRS